MILLVFFMIVPWLFMRAIMTWAKDKLNCSEEVIDYATEMVKFVMISAFVRSINSNIKTWYQSIEVFHNQIAKITVGGILAFFISIRFCLSHLES
jgi:Na+-driven multidrug efflux pump